MSHSLPSLKIGEEKNSPSNQRATVRYQCPPATPGRVILVADQEFQRGWIQDLSAAGAGLHLNRPLPVGAFAIIQTRSPITKKLYELPARVVHSTLKPNGEWHVGFELTIRLTDADLDALL